MKFRQLNYSLHMAVEGLVGRRETAHKSNQLWNHFRTNYEIKFTEHYIRSRVRNNTFVVLKVISSDLIPTRWVSETHNVSLLM